MKYYHLVKHNGKYYKAGDEVPEKEDESPVLDSETPQEYSKTVINRMAKADLLDLAAANGIEADEYTSGTVLKEMLIDKLVKQV
jgi:hypothetical protein